MNAIGRELRRKGLVRSARGTNPDLHASITSVEDTPPQDLGHGLALAGSPTLRGRLILELVDTRTGRLVWRASAPDVFAMSGNFALWCVLTCYACPGHFESRARTLAHKLVEEYPLGPRGGPTRTGSVTLARWPFRSTRS